MVYDFKTMTPDSTFSPGSAFLFGADSQASTSPSLYPASVVLEAAGSGTYISVKDYGASGSADAATNTAAIQAALDDAFGSSGSPHGFGYGLNKAVWFPPGLYQINAPLTLTGVMGGILQGAGRFSTTIQNVNNTGIFVTNGCSGVAFRDMCLFHDGGTAPLIDADWDNIVGGNALQSNTFHNIYFSGGSIGLRIGNTGYMGSENLILNCYFSGNTTYGIDICHYNALMNTILGGNFQACGTGIYVAAGSTPIIHGVSFQTQTAYDIEFFNAAYDTVSIQGCRTESANFVKNWATFLHIDSCLQGGGGSGVFYTGSYGGHDLITNCVSVEGVISNVSNDVRVERSIFVPSGWASNSNITVSDVWGGVSDPYTLTDPTKYYRSGRINTSGVYTPNASLKKTVYNTVSGGSPLTLTATNMAGHNDVVVNLTAALGAGGAVTTDTAANIIAAVYYVNDMSYKLRIVNSSSGAFSWTLAGGTDVTITGNATIAQNTWNEYLVTALTSTTVELKYVGKGTF